MNVLSQAWAALGVGGEPKDVHEQFVWLLMDRRQTVEGFLAFNSFHVCQVKEVVGPNPPNRNFTHLVLKRHRVAVGNNLAPSWVAANCFEVPFELERGQR